MAPKEFLARAARARRLAERFPEAEGPLGFYAEIASFQAEVEPDAPLEALPRLVALVLASAPEPLKARARSLDRGSLERAMTAYRASADSEEVDAVTRFFARVLLQASRIEGVAKAGGRGCPRCGHPAQAGSLRPEGHGTALSLVCSLCLHEWGSPRELCRSEACSGGKALVYYEAAEIPHLRVQACDRCRRYIHLVRLDLEPEAIAEVDEIGALALDVWAREKDYRKLCPNLVGI
jgi:FdhE protein